MEQFHSLNNKELVEQYKKAGFFGQVGFGERPALLVIDMAKNWTDPSQIMGSDLSNVLSAIKRLLAVAREKKVPIFFTTMGFDPQLKELGQTSLRKTPQGSHMIRGSDHLQLEPELDRREDESLIEKQRGSAFFATNLLSMLLDERIDTVIVTGCSTSGCIRETVVDARNLNFHIIIPEEAVGDRSWSAHEANLFDMAARQADVVGVDEVLEYFTSLPDRS